MKPFILFSLFLGITIVNGQKTVEKQWINPAINAVVIDANNIFDISLSTSTEKKISVTANMEGEYADNLIISIREVDNTITISSKFSPTFYHPNDKLSAHKVVSIQLVIQLPESLNVQLSGTSTTVQASGNYKNLAVALNDGNCSLNNILGTIEVKTQSGQINLNTKEANVKAHSIYGNVVKNNVPIGSSEIKLATIEGDIYINEKQ